MASSKIVLCSFCNTELKRHQSKTDKYFCNKYCKGKWQKKQREKLGFTKEFLIQEYIINGKSADQISREIGRDAKCVWTWIHEYGIKIRSRGTDYGQCFKKGQESAFKGKKHTEENKEKTRQARLKDGRIPCYVNGVHWMHYYNRKPASWRGGITPERQAFYASKEWVNAVKKVWERDGAICQRCGKKHNIKKNRGTFHIHHIVTFINKEKRGDPNNLILLCKTCHLWVHSNKNINKEFIIDG